MNFEIEISEAFRKAAKSLAKKHPSFKKDLTEYLESLARKPTSGTPLGGGFIGPYSPKDRAIGVFMGGVVVGVEG